MGGRVQSGFSVRGQVLVITLSGFHIRRLLTLLLGDIYLVGVHSGGWKSLFPAMVVADSWGILFWILLFIWEVCRICVVLA